MGQLSLLETAALALHHLTVGSMTAQALVMKVSSGPKSLLSQLDCQTVTNSQRCTWCELKQLYVMARNALPVNVQDRKYN